MGMFGNGGGVNCFPKPCDSCKLGAAILFCRTDAAFVCMACDERLHVGARHERVWTCEVCEQAPASVMCRADAAALCLACDCDIHSVNPLAQRHERVPVVPFCTSAKEAAMNSSKWEIDVCPGHNRSVCDLDNTTAGEIPVDLKPVEFVFSDPDQLLDFDFPVANDARLPSYFNSNGSDSVVPVQTVTLSPPPAKLSDNPQRNYFEIDFTRSNLNSSCNSYNTHSIRHSVSTSSMDAGVVPEGSSVSEMSYLQMNNSHGNSSSSGNQRSQLLSTDREARVLRYREKRKNRKFEKTIRYASRKAYAETRPRIKGRFAKRTEIDTESDRWVTGSSVVNGFFRESEYGVVPSF